VSSTHPTPMNLRLFVALPIPAPVRTALLAALDRSVLDAGDLRRTLPEGWHVTLAFLGDTPAERLPDVADAVTSVLAQRPLPDQISLGRPGRFGEHTLWIGVDDEPPGSIGRLGADLQSCLADADLPVKQRVLRPHLTVARARRGGRVTPTDVRALDAIPPTLWQPLTVEVWQAHLGNGPARYTTEASVAHKDTGHRNESGDSAGTT
jgi:RNA 2',3'-cyclic 3'-phosphodiesterase